MSDTKAGRPIWEGHRQRLRQRMERDGWDALRPHEMVELVLNYAVPRQNLSDIARALVDRFGSVGGVFGADFDQLMAVEGMTRTLAQWVGITGDLVRAYYDLHAEDDIPLSCFQEVADFVRTRLEGANAPALWAVYADFDFNLITFTDYGDVREWWEADRVRGIMVEAIHSGARYVYLVRLTGDGPMAMDDVELARLEAISSTLRAADIDLMDCVLAGPAGIYSLRRQGKLKVDRANERQLALHEGYLKSDSPQ